MARFTVQRVHIGALAAFAASLAAVLLAHGVLPGMVSDASARFLTEGAVRCMEDLGLAAVKPWCHDYGQPFGYPLLTNGPLIMLATVFAHVPGVTVSAAVTLATATVLAVALAGGYAFARRLRIRPAVALLAATAYLVTPTVVGMASFPGTALGYTLLPAYAAVDLWVIDAVKDGRRGRALLLIGAAYLGVRGSALFLDGYSFIVSSVLGVVLWSAWMLRERPALKTIGIGVGLLCGANLGAFLAYRWYAPTWPTPDNIEIARAMGLDVITLIVPSDRFWLAQELGLSDDHTSLWGDGTNSAYNFAGLACLVLALVALTLRPRRTLVVPVAVAGVVALVLSLGPSLKIDDRNLRGGPVTYESYLMPASAADLELPWGDVVGSLPGFQDARASYRWYGLVRLALVFLAAVAVDRLLSSRRRSVRAVAVAVGVLAVVEVLPDVPRRVELAQAASDTVAGVRDSALADLRAVTEEGDRVLFLHSDESVNDFLANYLAAEADVRAYNAGGDKNVGISVSHWPAAIGPAAAPGATADAAVAALQQDADVLIVPFFHLRWNAYAWPPTEEQRRQPETVFASLLADPRLRVDRRDDLAAVRLRATEAPDG